MDAAPVRDLEAVIEELQPPEAVDKGDLEIAAGRFDEIARVLSDALSRAQD